MSIGIVVERCLLWSGWGLMRLACGFVCSLFLLRFLAPRRLLVAPPVVAIPPEKVVKGCLGLRFAVSFTNTGLF